MTDDRRARWRHYDDAPEGELLGDRFAAFRRPLAGFPATGIDMSVVVMDPGQRGPRHAHDGTMEEYYVVLEGTVDVELPDETVRGRPGTVFFFPPGATHRPTNASADRAVFLSMRTGEGDPTPSG